MQSATITNIVPALIAARKNFKAAIKDSTNPHFKSKYVSLEGVIDAISDALLDNGIFLTQMTSVSGEQTILQTSLLHTSGEWISGDYPIHPVKPDPQGEGSAMTYARRYALMGLVGIAPEDDDGNAAVAASKPLINRIRDADIKPGAGVLESLSKQDQDRARKIATTSIEYFEADDINGAVDYLGRAFNQDDGTEFKIAVNSLLPSNFRTALKVANKTNSQLEKH